MNVQSLLRASPWVAPPTLGMGGLYSAEYSQNSSTYVESPEITIHIYLLVKILLLCTVGADARLYVLHRVCGQGQGFHCCCILLNKQTICPTYIGISQLIRNRGIRGRLIQKYFLSCKDKSVWYFKTVLPGHQIPPWRANKCPGRTLTGQL